MRFVSMLLLLMLAACGQGGGAARSGGADTLTRLMDSDSRGLDPQIISDIASVRIASDLFEGLTRFNADGVAEPGLAVTWKTSADGKSWTFRLRDGLKFSDGIALKAQVFPAAFARINDEASGSPHGSLFSVIGAVDAPTRRL